VLNILCNRLDLNTARILYLVPLTSHTRACARTRAISDVRWDQELPSRVRNFTVSLTVSLKGRHTGLETCLDSYVRERTFEHRRFTRSIICERVFANPVPGPSRGVFFSRRREVESCRSKCGKRSVLLADLCEGSPPLYRKKGTNPPLSDFETRAFFLFVVARNSTVFDECIFHRAYCYVLYHRKRARAFALRWINTLSFWNIPKFTNIQSSLETLI